MKTWKVVHFCLPTAIIRVGFRGDGTKVLGVALGGCGAMFETVLAGDG